MRALLLLAGCAAMTASAALAEEKEKPKLEPAKLVGKWTLTSAERGGDKKDADDLKDWAVEFTKDSLVLKAGPAEFVAKYKVDASKSPAVLMMEITKTPVGEPGTKGTAIVELDGDALKLCYVLGEKAPKGFESKKGDEARMVVLRRAKK